MFRSPWLHKETLLIEKLAGNAISVRNLTRDQIDSLISHTVWTLIGPRDLLDFHSSEPLVNRERSENPFQKLRKYLALELKSRLVCLLFRRASQRSLGIESSKVAGLLSFLNAVAILYYTLTSLKAKSLISMPSLQGPCLITLHRLGQFLERSYDTTSGIFLRALILLAMFQISGSLNSNCNSPFKAFDLSWVMAFIFRHQLRYAPSPTRGQ